MAMVSPELALVDPELREWALEQLPALEAYDFLRPRADHRRNPDLETFGFLAAYGDAETFRRSPPPRVVAAAVYAASAMLKALAFDALFVLAVAAAIAATQIFG
jgi:hypothetical protein